MLGLLRKVKSKIIFKIKIETWILKYHAIIIQSVEEWTAKESVHDWTQNTVCHLHNEYKPELKSV